MLNTALSLEEIKMISILENNLKLMEESSMDETTKEKIKKKLRRILDETIIHSEILNKLIKKVVESESGEF